MPRQTAILGLRTPLPTEAPDGAGGMATLADDIDALLGGRLPRTLVIAQRNSGGSPTLGAWGDVNYDTVLLNPLGVLQSNGISMVLPYDGIYEIESLITFQSAPGSGGRLLQKWYVPGGVDGPWQGVTNQAGGVPLLYRNTFGGAAGITIRSAFFMDGSGTAALYTQAAAPAQIPRVVLRYLGKNA